MITCLGLIVGVVTSASRQDVLNQCTEFLKNHKYLLGSEINFEIDREVYATVKDSSEQSNGNLLILFKTYDGRPGVGVA